VLRRSTVHATRLAIALLCAVAMPAGLAAPGTAAAQTSLRQLGLPEGLQLGLRDPEHGASALRRSVPARYRYHYLSGGANTGRGWSTWADGGGSFVTGYVQDSLRNGFVPVFSLYQLQESLPGRDAAEEPDRVRINLNDVQAMRAWFTDLRLFFTRAGAFGGSPIVLQVEPDLWGYAQRDAPGDDLGRVPAQVAATAIPELAGLPDSVAGLAQAVVRLRDASAPNVVLGYQLSMWGTGQDIAYSDPPDSEVDALAGRASAAYASLHAAFDLVFVEYTDRDAGLRTIREGSTAAWWDDEDFRRNVRFLSGVSSQIRIVLFMWQVPLGNTLMRAMNNTPGHYQDNKVQWLLGAQRDEHLEAYVRSGVAAFLFGHAVPQATCACDEQADGITNPEPINANNAASLSADDDGGFARDRISAYYAAGVRGVPAGPVAPPPSAPTPARAAAVAMAAPLDDPLAPAQIAPAAVKRPAARVRITVLRGARAGSRLRIKLRLRVPATVRRRVDLEVRAPSGKLVFGRAWHRRRLRFDSTHSFAATWRLRRDLRPGRYTVKVVLSDPGRPRLRSLVHGSATVSVTPSP